MVPTSTSALRSIFVIAAFELLGVPHTGCGFGSLFLCMDKALSKMVLRHHRVGIAAFVVSRARKPIRKVSPSLLPAFVKPLAAEASEGIAKATAAPIGGV